MTDRMHITASERGQIRVFAVDLPPEEARPFAAPGNATDWPLRDALGATALDPDWVDLVTPSDLGAMPLSDFLAEGPGASPEALEADRPRLDALETPVVVMPSQAFCGEAQDIAPRAPLRWIGTYPEPRAALPEAPLRSSAAEGHLSPKGAGKGAGPGPAVRIAGYVAAALVVVGVIVLALSQLGGGQ